MIKYIGSKRLLVPNLLEVVAGLPKIRTVIDLFAGTSRVGHALKQAGYQVLANDHNAYAHTLASCYVQADANRWATKASKLIEELQGTAPRPGYVTETFCQRSRFFHPKNGAKIDAIRERIETLDVDPALRAIVLVSLMEAADRVDSTTGLQMAYLKQWAPRAHNDLTLRLPAIVPGPGEASQQDAVALLQTRSADLIYLDPPYNQHNYLRNYHIWESLVLWDKPEVYGVACKRVDCRTRTSDFNSKRRIHTAMGELINGADATHLLISFNNEGHISREEMMDLLAVHGDVHVRDVDHPRYVGARIGIYNPDGKKVGRVRHLRNVEHLFHVRRTRRRKSTSPTQPRRSA
jgi:adenine-specific DNA-methyltransferase